MFSQSQAQQSSRSQGVRTTPSLFSTMFSIMFFLTSISSALAHETELDPRVYNSDTFQRLALRGEIHIDSRAPPALHRAVVERRGQNQTTSTATSSTSSTSSTTIQTSIPSIANSTIASESTVTPTSTTTTAPSVTIITTPIPSPFDTSLGSNFTTQACPDFFASFLSNATFRSCIPVSLLLQNSNSFFRAERDATLLSETLDSACNAPVALCTPLLQSIATQLIDPSNCGTDFEQQNPLVSQAYAGLVAYEPVYSATCLRDPATGNYCFSEAITNASAASDAYPYYTALGLVMPKGSRPTCSTCLKETMNIFALYASNASQPLSSTYGSCAQQIDAGCGKNFVALNVTVLAASGGVAAASFSFLVSAAALALAMIAVL